MQKSLITSRLLLRFCIKMRMDLCNVERGKNLLRLPKCPAKVHFSYNNIRYEVKFHFSTQSGIGAGRFVVQSALSFIEISLPSRMFNWNSQFFVSLSPKSNLRGQHARVYQKCLNLQLKCIVIILHRHRVISEASCQ